MKFSTRSELALPAQQRFAQRVRRAAVASGGLLVPIAHSREMTAYALSPERSGSPQ